MSSTRGHQAEAAIPVEAPANVLCRAPSLSDGSTEVCPSVGDHDEPNLLLVSLTGNPHRRLETWKRHGADPERVAILSVEESRSVAATDGGGTTVGPDGTPVTTTTVSEPGDLTGIGIKLTQCLSSWADDATPTVVCVDSLTTLLQYVDPERVFRFLQETTNRVETVGAVAHYHVDPGAHDEQTLSTIAGAFSEDYRYDTDGGEWHST